MKLTKKLTVLLLVLAMALSCLPMAAFATELEEPNQTETVSAETIPEEVVEEESALSPVETEPVIVETEPATETAEPIVEETEPVVMETLSAVQDEAMNAEEGNTEPTIVNSGVCGDNLTWTLDSEGVLVISGEGDMTDYYSSSTSQPWASCLITKVIFEPGITKIGDSAFYNYSSVTEVSIPDTVTHIGSRAFRNPRIVDLYLPDSVVTMDRYAFDNCIKLETLRLPRKITELGESIFQYCTSLKEVVLPDSLTKIGWATFRNCSNLESITFPKNLKTIRGDAFRYCTSLEQLYLPDSVSTIEGGAFMDCSNLLVAYLPANLTTISKMLFNDCSSLLAIFIPGKLTFVDDNAFARCHNLSEVYYLGTEAQIKNLRVSNVGNDPLLNADWYLSTIATKQPSDVKTIAGKTVKFSTASSRSNCTFQWYYLAPDSEEWQVCSGSSAKTATYSFTAKASMDGYWFCCVITDEYGSEFSCNSALLTIIPAPKITKQPEDAMVKSGQTITATVEAEGENLTYTWYYAKKGSSTYTKSSITTNTYSTTMDSSRNGRKVYCVVKDAYGQSVKSATATLWLETTPLVITQQPESITVKNGEKAAVTVKASGDGLTYKWYYAKAGSSSFSKSSTTGKTYSTTMNTDRDGRQVYCVVTDQYGKTAKTETVTLNMNKTPLKLISAPEGVTVKNGKTATVTVEAEGDGLTYAWYYAKAGSTKFTKSSTTKKTYSTTMNADRDGRQLYCIVKDAYGQKIKTDVVSIHMS